MREVPVCACGAGNGGSRHTHQHARVSVCRDQQHCLPVFYGIGRARESAAISSARGFVLLLTAIFVLPALFGITGLWSVSVVTETLTLLLTLLYLKRDGRAARAGQAGPSQEACSV